jgi:hypothetical protein
MKCFSLSTKDGLFSAICKLDDEDYIYFSSYYMYIERRSDNIPAYIIVQKYDKRSFPRLHRILGEKYLNIKSGQEIDHIDRDRFNNTRSNLRVCTRLQNLINRPVEMGSLSKYKGVVKRRNSWMAQIRSKTLASFKSERLAAICYDLVAKEEYGEFHSLNILDATDQEISLVKEDMLKVKRKPRNKVYTGVTYNKLRNKWLFSCTINGKYIRKYGFNSDIEAYNERQKFIQSNNLI